MTFESARQAKNKDQVFETRFLIELIILTAIRLGDIYISFIDNAIKKTTAVVVMDDIITTRGRIFMEGRRQPVGRLRGRRAKSKMSDRVAIVRWPVHLRAPRSVACFIVNEIEEIISNSRYRI